MINQSILDGWMDGLFLLSFFLDFFLVLFFPEAGLRCGFIHSFIQSMLVKLETFLSFLSSKLIAGCVDSYTYTSHT